MDAGVKRFWKKARAERVEGGWLIRLDARPVRTPARRLCVVPIAAMADGIAAEWNAQADRIDPLSMPLTRAAVREIDRRAVEEFGIPSIVLMENAGRGATEVIHRLNPLRERVAIVCGLRPGEARLVLAPRFASYEAPGP